MKHYLLTFHETDGNDATVYDCIISTYSEDLATDHLHDTIASNLKSDGIPFSEDGSPCGFIFDCQEGFCSEQCDGHGGIVLRSIETYDSMNDAKDNLAPHHVRYYV